MQYKQCYVKKRKNYRKTSLTFCYQPRSLHNTSELRSAKKVYFHHLADNICTPRDFWTQYHKFNPKHSRTPANVFHKGTEVHSPTEKANLFNNFFTSCFTNSKLVPSVSHLPHPPSTIQRHLLPQRSPQASLNTQGQYGQWAGRNL